LHNTEQKRADRAQMLAGDRPPGCEYCWKIEDMGRDAVSDRVYKSKIYPIEDINAARNTPWDQDVNLRTLEIAFDRTCQLACSYCNPAFSSSWVRDIKKYGAYTQLVSDGRNHFTHTHDSSQLYSVAENNPYVDAFFAWWESDLHQSLQELRITGGEPLMSAHTWRLVDWFKSNAGKSNTRLAINSNLGPNTDIPRLIDATRDMSIDLYTSCESVGSAAEYIRSGLDYAQWQHNVETLLESRQFRGLHVMNTINALCLTTLADFLEYIVELKKRYGRDAINFTLNILRFPSFQSATVLSDDLRTQYRSALVDFSARHQGASYLHEYELNHVLRLTDYLDVVKTPHDGAADVDTLRKDFKSFYTQYDQRRGLNFESTFPELVSWWRTL
jgi:organic radical activating enzyme